MKNDVRPVDNTSLHGLLPESSKPRCQSLFAMRVLQTGSGKIGQKGTKGVQPLWPHREMSPASPHFLVDETCFHEFLEVVGQRRLTHSEQAVEMAGAHTGATVRRDVMEDAQPHRIRQRLCNDGEFLGTRHWQR